ncbi:alcohol oxidase [Suillus fuscotomentosus]|uniref:Alcohol oxidase n=1 Tax=Suillus fuscotomentosus TaxID=1912939 RepID=A0AAD4HGC2_9AGAM|nr:alcohol oxidase [Suillus fuscotomentosus]KAG1894479.1 alcohol oxidase [Suillus fuscotomentosus]
MLTSVDGIKGQVFDYIIIGGGTTGLVLVTRLSENPSTLVLVLEAGSAHIDDANLLIPQQCWLFVGKPEYDWSFKTVTQRKHNITPKTEYSLGLGGKDSEAVPQSTISSGISQRANKLKASFICLHQHLLNTPTAWGALGNDGWTWEKFQAYSKKSERFVEPNHNTDVLTIMNLAQLISRPIVTSFPPLISNLEADFRKAMEAHNVPNIQDAFSGEIRGTSPSLSNLDPSTHHRSYATNMYYQPVAGRTNLKVIVDAYVTEIITTKVNGLTTAIGVKFVKSDNTYTANVAGEVCLTAGTIMSPKILELSGIGDPAVLRRAGIDVKLDLPGVGMNVLEHLYTGVTFELTDHFAGEQEVNTFDSLATNLGKQKESTLNLNTVDIAFVALADISPELNAKVTASLQTEEKDAGLAAQYKIQAEHLREKVPSLEILLAPGPANPPPQGWDASKKHVSLCFATNCPLSRGTIHVTSKDSLAIDPHVYENRFDLDTMVELVKYCRRLAQTPPLKGEGEGRLIEIHPGPDCQDDAAIAEWICNNVNTTFHTAGSCSMLPKELNGVVDPQLKVWGTHNIRVADLSIIPLHVGSHTQSVAYALAEQGLLQFFLKLLALIVVLAADIIKASHEK